MALLNMCAAARARLISAHKSCTLAMLQHSYLKRADGDPQKCVLKNLEYSGSKKDKQAAQTVENKNGQGGVWGFQ